MRLARHSRACALLTTVGLSLVVAVPGCNSIIGTRDLYQSECLEGAAPLATDPKNCGRCRNDCAGKACVAGQCVAGTAVVSIASDAVIIKMALDNDFIYFIDAKSKSIVRIRKNGSERKVLGTSNMPSALDVGATYVVWADASSSQDGGGVYRCPKDVGCSTTPSPVPGEKVSDVALVGPERSGEKFVFAEQGSGKISLFSGVKSNLANIAKPAHLSVSSDSNLRESVYFTSDGVGLLGVTVPDGIKTAFQTSPYTLPTGAVAARGDRVFWTSGGSNAVGNVLSAPLSELFKTTTTYASEMIFPTCIAADGKNVMWGTFGADGEASGGAYLCPVGGCGGAPTVLIDKVQVVDIKSDDIKPDDRAIYVALQSGGIRKFPKP